MNNEKVLLEAVVCYPIKNKKVLLGFKTKNIGENCWNGYGGGIEEGESIEQAAIRELEEEAGIFTSREYLGKIAVIDFHNTKSDGNIFVCRVHFFIVSKWVGDPQESDEMITPTWFGIDSLPLEKMMPADVHWLPLALRGKKIVGRFFYGPRQKELIGEAIIQEVEQFEF